MAKYKIIIAVLVFLLIGQAAYHSSQNQKVMGETVQRPSSTPTITATLTPTASQQLYKVIKVIDGDTIAVDLNGKDETIRIIGIDTPELVDPRKPVQCFAKEASDKAKSILTDQFVLLEADSTQDEKDKYNRLLRYVFLKNGTDYGKMMISEGFAHEYTYQIPYKYQKEYKEAENQAREGKRGFWADGACVAPTLIPTSIPPTQIYYSPTPIPQTQIYVPPAQNNSSGFTCNCSKGCDAMASCEEAYYQLRTCGCSQRDGDSDGVPCEKICN